MIFTDQETVFIKGSTATIGGPTLTRPATWREPLVDSLAHIVTDPEDFALELLPRGPQLVVRKGIISAVKSFTYQPGAVLVVSTTTRQWVISKIPS